MKFVRHYDNLELICANRFSPNLFLRNRVVVSHDRHFLNTVVTDVVHFHKNTLATYRGDITNYETVVTENKIRQQRQREQQEAKRAHLQKYIDLHAQAGENGVKASRQRKSKMKKLDKLGVMAQVDPKYGVEAPVRFLYGVEDPVDPESGLWLQSIPSSESSPQWIRCPALCLLLIVDLKLRLQWIMHMELGLQWILKLVSRLPLDPEFGVGPPVNP